MITALAFLAAACMASIGLLVVFRPGTTRLIVSVERRPDLRIVESNDEVEE